MVYIHQAQYYETDQMGIIHHSNYIRWMEEARIAYMEEMDFPYHKVEEAGIISPVLSVQCDYKSMTHFGDRVVIEVKLISFKGVKYSISYTMRDEQTKEVRAVGTSSHCYLKKDGRPVSIKRELPELYEKMKKAAEEEA
jgi:acyl-CoA thioester hydrolase